MFFTRISEIKRKKSESYIGFDKSTSTLEERLQAHLRRFSPYPFGSVGKGLERETLCPFPRVRRFGTHSETGSKFLLLFSIKSKEEILCFAEKVPNGRNLIFTKKNYSATALNQCAALLLFSLAHVAFINPIGACTATFPHKKKTPFGSFSINHTSPSGSHKKYAPAWQYTPSDNLRS